MKYIWIIILVVVSICAYDEPCQWDQYLGNPGRTAHTDCSGPDSPEVLWEITLDGTVDTPFIVGDKVIVLAELYCVFPTPPEEEPESHIVVIDLLTGEILRKVVPDVDLLRVYPAGDAVLIDSGGKLYEIDLMSEEVSYCSNIPRKCFYSSVFQDCYPLILPDKIVFPTTPLVCLSRFDYSTLWNLEASLGSLYPDNAKILNIAASMELVYIILEEENGIIVLAVDADTGALVWMNHDLEVLRVASDGHAVYVAGDNLYALDAKTGAPLWTFELDSALSNIAVGPTAVYHTDTANHLYAVDKNTGELRWKTPWEEAEWITYIVEAGNIIICSNILNMAAFSALDGRNIWNMHFRDYSGPFPEKPCPAVAEGIIVIPEKEEQEGDSFVMIRPEKLVALASNPELFVKQGDAFLSESLTEKAIYSYRKAQGLYERKGNLDQAHKMQEQIVELENLQETTPPTPPGTTPPESQQPPISPTTPPGTTPIPIPPPAESALIPISVLIMTSLMGIFIAYYFTRKRRP